MALMIEDVRCVRRGQGVSWALPACGQAPPARTFARAALSTGAGWVWRSGGRLAAATLLQGPPPLALGCHRLPPTWSLTPTPFWTPPSLCSTMDCSTYTACKFKVLYRAPPLLPAALAYRDMLMRRQASLDDRQRERQQAPAPQLRRAKSLPCQLPSHPAADAPKCDGGLGEPMQSLPTPAPVWWPAHVATST